MASRSELQTIFETILGCRHVYFQPPESVRMQYPAIRYSLSNFNVCHANNSIYKKMTAYAVILIDEDPESEFLDPIFELPYCTFDRSYISDNLNHFVFTLYF